MRLEREEGDMGFKNREIGRKFYGWLSIGISLINLAANLSWLKTGDIHQLQLHITMRGGWVGFWVTTVLFVVVGFIGFYLIVTKEPAFLHQHRTELTPEEKRHLQAWGRNSIIYFIVFWVFFICGVFLTIHIPILEVFIFMTTIVVAMVLCMILRVFSKCCPNCGFRLAYHHQLILPKTCPDCGIAFK